MKVIVGLSGGVDSAVAAFLLKKEAYDVEGLFMRNWDSSLNNDFQGNPDLFNHDICPQEEDYEDALKVADHLGIKLHRVDFVEEYWNYVFLMFLDELKHGRTPNPDVFCNSYIKFQAFKDIAFEKFGADFIATGHYAKLIGGKLFRPKDLKKDQSYFLADLTNDQLKNVLFPLANLTKEEVRKIAEEENLPVFNKKDSTGICFIGERHFQDFLKNYLPNIPGDIINIETGEVLKKHIGLMYYTIGQRRGLNIGGSSERLFVVGKNLEKNILYVASTSNNYYLKSDGMIIEHVNLRDSFREEVIIQHRYRGPKIKAKLRKLSDGNIFVSYDAAYAVTPGQICAIYSGDEQIGSGIIKEVWKNNSKLWYLL